jgi:hypothetical protein
LWSAFVTFVVCWVLAHQLPRTEDFPSNSALGSIPTGPVNILLGVLPDAVSAFFFLMLLTSGFLLDAADSEFDAFELSRAEVTI